MNTNIHLRDAYGGQVEHSTSNIERPAEQGPNPQNPVHPVKKKHRLKDF